MPPTFRFVHTADLHLDSAFSGLTKISPEIRDILQDATLKAFDAIVRKTIESDAAFLLIAGDIYDGASSGLPAQLRFRDRLDKLSKRGIPAGSTSESRAIRSRVLSPSSTAGGTSNPPSC